MFEDFTIFLWLLKLGVLVNLYFLANTLVPPGNTANPRPLVPAQILFAVSGFRCLFPNQYKGNVVFHDTPLSSIFLTRLLAMFAEGQIDVAMKTGCPPPSYRRYGGPRTSQIGRYVDFGL